MLAEGAAFLIVRLRVCVSLRAGEPLSVTRTVTLAIAGPSGGIQVNKPVFGSILAPAGAASRLKTMGSASGSVAFSIKENVLPSSTVLLATGSKTGGLLGTLTFLAPSARITFFTACGRLSKSMLEATSKTAPRD